MEPIGDLLDALGVQVDMRDGEMATDAVVVLKVVGADGAVGVRTLWSVGATWYDRRALLEIARDAEVANIGTEG